MKILITGPVGSGKSTQAKSVAEKFGLHFVSAGDLLRKKALEKTVDGRVAKQAIKEGQLVDDELMGGLVQEKINHNDCKNGFVLDGYPRRVDQLKYFDPQFDKVFYLQVSDEEVIKRLLLRGRSDDKPEVIRERLGVYHHLTEPVLDYYQNQGKLIRIDGEKSIEEISQEIKERLEKGI